MQRVVSRRARHAVARHAVGGASHLGRLRALSAAPRVLPVRSRTSSYSFCARFFASVRIIWQRDSACTSASPLISSGAYSRSGCFPTHRRHRADAHGVRHAGVGRELADHVRLLLLMRPQRLADQHVAFAAVQPAVVVRLGEIAQRRTGAAARAARRRARVRMRPYVQRSSPCAAWIDFIFRYAPRSMPMWSSKSCAAMRIR